MREDIKERIIQKHREIRKQEKYSGKLKYINEEKILPLMIDYIEKPLFLWLEDINDRSTFHNLKNFPDIAFIHFYSNLNQPEEFSNKILYTTTTIDDCDCYEEYIYTLFFDDDTDTYEKAIKKNKIANIYLKTPLSQHERLAADLENDFYFDFSKIDKPLLIAIGQVALELTLANKIKNF